MNDGAGGDMADARRDTNDPLNFWLAIEAFSPQKIPPVSGSAGDVPYVADYPVNKPLPWEPEARRPRAREGFTWQHAVYLGVYDLESAWDVLNPEDVVDYNARSAQSAVAMLNFSEDGTLQFATATLSQCVWAAGQYARHGKLLDVFTDFSADEQGWRDALNSLIAERGVRVGPDSPEKLRTRSASTKDLFAILTQALEFTGSLDVLTLNGEGLETIRIASREIRIVRRETEAESDFLNSMFSADLYRLAQRPRHRGGARQYLEVDVSPSKVDVQQDLHVVYDAISPHLIPDGRWPSNVEHSLALSQQFAVNRALADLGNTSGIFSVNGPPGTGKTTMLRDMIAALVTQRATALVKFVNASDAFVEQAKLKSKEKYPRTVHRLHESVRGFEIVIASSNNGAVENISLEIPAKTEEVIASEFQDITDYFSDIASALLSDTDNRGLWHAPLTEAWGLVSARLGNSANKSRFISTALYADQSSGEEELPEIIGLFKILDNPAEVEVMEWQEARKSFLAAQRKVRELRAERQKLHSGFLEIPQLERGIDKLEKEITANVERREAQRRLVDEQSYALDKLRQKVDDRRADFAVHISTKPGWLEQIFTLGKAMVPWREQQTILSTEMTNIQTSLTGLMSMLEDSQRTLVRIDQKHNELSQALAADKRKKSEIMRAKNSYPYAKFCPSNQWFDPRNFGKEKASLWLDQEFNKARSLLFLESLNLHKSFIFDQYKKVKQSLQAVQDVFKSTVAAEASAEHVRWAWEALFLVIPTITTTFASVPRLFNSLGDKQLGWLFIDEAGQAAPQHAYCGIWRAQRTVLVGDPLQLTPVVTLPAKYQDRLLKITKTHERWLPALNPAQVLADRTTKYGTTVYPPDSDGLWVGAPLKVHRRCDNPMFDVVNHEVYGGLMIHGGKTVNVFPRNQLASPAPASAWFDVETLLWSEHASPQEIDKLEELLEALKKANYDMSEILVISPFKDTERQMRESIVRFVGIAS